LVDLQNVADIIKNMGATFPNMRRIGGFRIYTETDVFGGKRVTVYVDHVPVVQFDSKNLNEQKLAAIGLVERHHCSQTISGKICGLHRNTVFKALRIKRVLGIDAVFEDNRGPNGPSKYVGALRTHIKKLLRKHPQWTDQQVAEQAAADFSIKVSRSGVARIRTEKQDKNRKNPSKAQLLKMAEQADAIDRQRFDTRQLQLNFTYDEDIKEKSEKTAQEPAPKPAKISEKRLLDRLVQGERFNFSGALMHHLFLNEIGFSNMLTPFDGAPGATYGVGDVLGSCFFSAALAIPSIEALKLVNASEFGILLGTNRAPDKETIRHKLMQIAGQYKSVQLIDDFAKALLELDFIDRDVFFIDGHFLPYYGLSVIAKGYHTVRRMAMRGNELYAVTDLQGRVLFFITESNEIDFRPIIDRCAQKLISYGIPRPILVFDRGGYGIHFFSQLDETANFITWAKYLGDNALSRHEDSFFTVCLMQNGKKYRVGETRKTVSESAQTAKKEGRAKASSMDLRLVVLENIKTKKRVGIYTNNQDKPVHAIAEYMLSRWGDSENVFKKMMARFNLNYHPGYDIKELANQPLVDNPDIEMIRKAIRTLKKEVEEIEKDILIIEAKQHRRKDKRLTSKRKNLEKDITDKKEDIAAFEQKLNCLPEKLSIVEILKGKAMNRCDLEKKRLYDVVQFMAYNSRERLAEILRKCYDDSRDILQVLDMITDRAGYIKLSGRTLFVVLDWIESRKHRDAAKKFCHVLNQKGVRMEGRMKLKLSFHISRYPIHGTARPVHN
jgi:transposase